MKLTRRDFLAASAGAIALVAAPAVASQLPVPSAPAAVPDFDPDAELFAFLRGIVRGAIETHGRPPKRIDVSWDLYRSYRQALSPPYLWSNGHLGRENVLFMGVPLVPSECLEGRAVHVVHNAPYGRGWSVYR